MENEKIENNKKKKNIVIIIVLVLIVLLAASLLLWKNFKNNKLSKVEYETKQLSMFSDAFSEQVGKAKNSGMNAQELAYNMTQWIVDNMPSYVSNAVNLAGLKVLTTMGGGTSSSEEIIDILYGFDAKEELEKILTGNKNTAKKNITIRSNTVCKSVADAKYCVDKLSANVYITDINSSKWVILVHPFMTNGALIYNAIGEMYEKQGYNILAPDLRGFGNSDGSVAMGYLESLDVYDWIKDLNLNWENKSRYGTNIAPDTIIVHGISLGGATTLQLATNPDIAAANGKEPYTENLTKLNVKGFVDDCGYTSMSGIVTDMLEGGNADSLSSLATLFSSLGINVVEYMEKLKKIFEDNGIEFNLDQFNGGGSTNTKPGSSSSNKDGNIGSNSSDRYENSANNSSNENSGNNSSNENENSGNNSSNENSGNNSSNENENSGNNSSNENQNSGNNSSNENENSGNNSSNNIWDKYDEDYIQDPFGYATKWLEEYQKMKETILDNIGDHWGKIPSGGNRKIQSNLNNNVIATPINNGLLGSLNLVSGDLLDKMVGTAIMDLVGVGLTEDNYEKYSNVFSDKRKFPEGAKVVIIHGTADTTVPFSNANTVEKNIGEATLVKKWEVSGAPHAFVVVGSKKKEYATLVENFTKCVDNTGCTSID